MVESRVKALAKRFCPWRDIPLLLCLVVLTFLCLLPGDLCAQGSIPADYKHDTPGTLITPGKPVRVNVELALVNVTVTDAFDRVVTGLDQDNFRVFEEGVEQEIVNFSSEDVPVSIGVIFDMSGSMRDKINKSREAALEFFKTANPKDEFLLVTFNERAWLERPFTSDIGELQESMAMNAPGGRTALLDAIYLGLSEMRGAHNVKRALLIISDGGDNHSRYSEGDVRRLVQEADVQIYGIGIYSPAPPTTEEENGPALLSEISDLTGGRVFKVESLSDLPDIATKISMELRNQYVLGYKPSNRAHDARWRKIKVKLRPPRGLPPLTVYARTGYYAASQ